MDVYNQWGLGEVGASSNDIFLILDSNIQFMRTYNLAHKFCFVPEK